MKNRTSIYLNDPTREALMRLQEESGLGSSAIIGVALTSFEPQLRKVLKEQAEKIKAAEVLEAKARALRSEVRRNG